MRALPFLLPVAALAGCSQTPARPSAIPIVSTPMRGGGLERVIGQDARTLAATFGPADLDVREQGAQRLQFRGPFCVLDAYLYAPHERAEPVVTYIDARQLNGSDIDRASCVAALVRRKEAR